MENSATVDANVIREPRSAQRRRLRAVIRPWLTPKVIAGGAIVLILVVVGLLAPLIAPYDPNAQNLSQALRPPAWFSVRMRSALTRSDGISCPDCSTAPVSRW